MFVTIFIIINNLASSSSSMINNIIMTEFDSFYASDAMNIDTL